MGHNYRVSEHNVVMKSLAKFFGLIASFVLLFIGVWFVVNYLSYYINPGLLFRIRPAMNCDLSYEYIVDLLAISFGIYCIIASLFLWKKPKVGIYFVIGAVILFLILLFAGNTLIKCTGI
jgi:hypothetical protein